MIWNKNSRKKNSFSLTTKRTFIDFISGMALEDDAHRQRYLPSAPSSHLLNHLQRLHQTSIANPLFNANNRLSVPSISTIGDLSSSVDISAMHMNSYVPDRRMSEPATFGGNEKSTLSPHRPRSITPNKLESTLKLNATKASASNVTAIGGTEAQFGVNQLPISAQAAPPNRSILLNSTVEQHPNREVDLDEVEEGEMVEDKLIIPEEFKNYLNQVADIESANANVNGNVSKTPKTEEKVSNEKPQPNTMTKQETQSTMSQPTQPPFNSTQMWRNPSSTLIQSNQQNRLSPHQAFHTYRGYQSKFFFHDDRFLLFSWGFKGN